MNVSFTWRMGEAKSRIISHKYHNHYITKKVKVNMLYIKNNAWVTVNNDFWVTSEAICQ